MYSKANWEYCEIIAAYINYIALFWTTALQVYHATSNYRVNSGGHVVLWYT
jgi:hypothetical protein